MTFIQEILQLIYLRRWLVLSTAMGVPAFAFMMLLFAEPTYVATAKVWTKERREESNILQTVRSGQQEETHIKVQQEIIMSHHVFGRVVDRLDLTKAPPSQSIYSKLFGQPKPKKEMVKATHEQRRLEAIKALQKSVSVKALNPEVVLIVVKSNDPELSRRIGDEVIKAYQEVYLKLLKKEVENAGAFLEQRMVSFEKQVANQESRLVQFQAQNPMVLMNNMASVQPPSMSFGEAPMLYAPALLSKVEEYNPLPAVLKEQALLKMQRNRLATTSTETNPELQRLDKAITGNLELIDHYRNDLSKQAQLGVQYDNLKWGLKEMRHRFSYAVSELDKVQITRGTRIQEASVVSILQATVTDPVAVAPKKKMSLIISTVLGTIIGLALAYLTDLCDSTFHLPQELARRVEMPVVAVFCRNSSH